MKEIGYAIVGDGIDGFKFFGETFCAIDEAFYWENKRYRLVPISVEMTEELKEFYFY